MKEVTKDVDGQGIYRETRFVLLRRHDEKPG
jgi:hypothetical protein